MSNNKQKQSCDYSRTPFGLSEGQDNTAQLLGNCHCLLKLCDASLYSKLRDGKYFLPSNTEKVKSLVDRFFSNKVAHPYACIIYDILGSGKSAILNQVLKELQSKRLKKNIYYIDINDGASYIWNEFINNPEKYTEQSNGQRCKLLEEYIIKELQKDKLAKKLLGDSKNIQDLIKRVAEMPKNVFREKQIILIDNLDNLMSKILEELTRDNKISSENIKCLQDIQLHINKCYENIGSLHSKLMDKDLGGCLTVARWKHNLPAHLIIESNAFWTKNILTDIFMYYIAQGKTEFSQCIVSHCKSCKYRLSPEEIKFCRKFRKHKTNHTTLDNKSMNIYKRMQQKIVKNIELSDYNLKRFLYPFAHLNNEWCVASTERDNGKDFINRQIKGYYKKILPDINDKAMRQCSVFNTYFDLFSVDYGEIDIALLAKIEQFIITIAKQSYSPRNQGRWINQILKHIFDDSADKNDVAKLVFDHLKDNRILVDITPNEQKIESKKFKVSEFFKFVYGNTELFIYDKEETYAK